MQYQQVREIKFPILFVNKIFFFFFVFIKDTQLGYARNFDYTGVMLIDFQSFENFDRKTIISSIHHSQLDLNNLPSNKIFICFNEEGMNVEFTSIQKFKVFFFFHFYLIYYFFLFFID